MQALLRLFLNRNVILVFAFILGFLVPDFSVYLKSGILYLLSWMTAVSLSGFNFKDETSKSTILKYSIRGILLNYFLFGIIVILISYFLIDERIVFLGFVIIALSPPGNVIVPFVFINKGNISYATYGMIAGFLFLLVSLPLMFFIVKSDGAIKINVWDLIWMLFVLIILPFFVSFLIKKSMFFNAIDKQRGRIIDWSFFLIVYTIIGLNKNVIISQWQMLLIPICILVVVLFGFSALLSFILKKAGVKNENRIASILLFNVKNNGFSAAISLSFLGDKAAIPSVALSVVLLVYLILFPQK